MFLKARPNFLRAAAGRAMAVTTMNIQSRLRLILLVIIMVVLGGAAGYYHIVDGNPRFLDCLYMTIISLTSVGYGEVVAISGNPQAEIFTMVLITFGLGIIMYGISTLTALIVEGEVSGILRRKNMEQRIEKLSGHYIVCGGGQTGRHVIEELLKNRENAVLVEKEPERIAQARTLGDILYIEGDATDDANLEVAGIKKARGIVIALPSDKDTLYVTMSARMLAPGIRIISRMVDSKIEPKLRKAGANGVVSPNFIGGLRMASEMIRPTVVSFLDKMLRSTDKTLRIHEIPIHEGGGLDGQTLMRSGIRDRYGLLVLGAREAGSPEIKFNPPADYRLTPGATLIVMGEVERIAALRELA